MPELTFDLFAAFILSMLPIFELRGGIIYAAAKGIPFSTAFVVCILGNIIPVPFILLFVRVILRFFERFPLTARLVSRIEAHARANSENIRKRQLFGLFVFVAIPLPGTGAWTGALIAALMDLRISKSFFAIAMGVLGAGIVMSILSYFIPGLFFQLAN